MWPLRRIASSLVLVLVLVTAGCARATSAGEAAATGSAERPSHILLAVDNHNWSDVVVWLEHDGSRNRLGTVKAASRSVLHIPALWIGASHTVWLVAHRIGARGEFRSEGFSVQSDQIIDWTLESDLERSSLALR